MATKHARTTLQLRTANELANKYNLSKDDLSGKVTHDFMVQLSMDISKWREIAPHLGLEDVERESIMEDGKTNNERKLLMLEKWGAKFGSEATFFNLVQRLMSANRRDLAEKVCNFFAENVKQRKREVSPLQSSSSLNVLNDQEEQHVGQAHQDKHDEEEIELQDKALTKENQKTKTRKKKISMNLQMCRCLSICCCLAFFNIPAVIVITVGSTVYNGNVPPPATVTIFHDDVLLIGEFDPFDVGGIRFGSNSRYIFPRSHSNGQFYKVPCQDLIVLNRTTKLTKHLNVTQDKTYRINARYFAKGSRLEYQTEYDFQNTTSTLDCAAFIYIFESVGFYDSFLQYKTRSGFAYKQCARNGGISVTYTIPESKDYYTGLYIPKVSTVESMEIKFTGHLITYNISEYKYQPDCVVSPTQTSCTVHFEKQRFRTSKKTCVLASTPDDSSQIYYDPLGNAETSRAKITMIIVGSIVLVLAVYTVAGLIRAEYH